MSEQTTVVTEAAPTATLYDGQDGHMAMSSGAAIIANPALSITKAPAFVADATSTNDTDTGPIDSEAAIAAWLEHGPSQSPAELAQIDAADRTAAEQELRAVWQERYEHNVRLINQYLDDDRVFGSGDVARHARRPDGHALANDPAELQKLLGLALRERPASGGGNVAAEIQEIEKFMRNQRSQYNQNEPLQARYRELLSLHESESATSH